MNEDKPLFKSPLLIAAKKGGQGLLQLSSKVKNKQTREEMKRHALAILELVAVVQKAAEADLVAPEQN